MSVVRTADAASQRKIAFAAPETIHGALKQIVGWAEMNGIHVQGKPLTEREFINGLIAGFWASGRDQWESKINQNAQSFVSLKAHKD